MSAASAITITAPRLYRKQYAAIFDPERHSVIEASTKAGKTLGCLVWQIDQTFRRPGEHWWVAPIYAQARIAYKRAKKMLPEGIYTANDSRQEIALINGATWTFKSADNIDSLYGEDVHSAVIDEASRCKEGTWEAIRSTLTATRGQSRVIGNVKGRKNWAYQLARRAEAGAEGYAFHRLTAFDAVDGGVLAKEEIEQARRDVSEEVFRQLYLAEPADDGANPFGLSAIDALIDPEWAPAPVVCWGIDLAKSVDWTVLVGLDKSGHVAQIHRWQGTPWKETIARIRRHVGATPALVDSTGVGDPIVEELQAGGDGDNFEGFKFTSSSKQQIMEGLAVDIQSGAPRMPEGVLAMELRDFEFAHTRTGVRYEAPTGLHDDCVCALALARAKWRASSTDLAWWT